MSELAELKRALVWRCFTQRNGKVKVKYVDELGRRADEDTASHIKARVYYMDRSSLLLDELEGHVRAIPGLVRSEQMIGVHYPQVVAMFRRASTTDPTSC